MAFPEDFVWGAATASYQIEGTPTAAGGGESVWDMFCRRSGVVYEGASGEIACDHYNRWRADVDLMSELGLRAYRFSTSWSRILPEGVGRVNEAGLEFYDRLVDTLLEAGITPYLTLFHWDLPTALYARGGWLNRDSADWFADYTRIVIDRLSDRVRHWMTLNEPQCFIGLGMLDGIHAPGDRIGINEVLRAAHHALLAHGRAVQLLRASAKTPPLIGYAPVGVVRTPATGSMDDIQAARASMFDMDSINLWNNAWWNDPVFEGKYPEDGLRLYAAQKAAPPVRPGDMELIAQPLDFFGANIYNGHPVRRNPDTGKPESVPYPQGMARTMYGWPVTPESLYWGPRFYYERYGKPILITENGLANMDWPSLDGEVADPQRIDFLRSYLLAFEHAIDDGVKAIGYFHWSLMDNFEWQEGYKMRFGLVHVDYTTQRRTPKQSASWYRRVIETNGASLHDRP